MNETWWVDQSQLDETQKAILTERPETDLLILGPPGSGKTNILMLRANYVRNVAPRTLFITFTRTLTEFLRSGPNTGREDQIKTNEITTFMAWGRSLLNEYKVPVPKTVDSFAKDRANLIQAVNELMDGEEIGELYDVIFIDEVQDFVDGELQILNRISRRVNAAGDSRQEIYQAKQGLKTIESFVEKTVKLETHYRVGAKICEFADQILPPKPDERPLAEGCNYDEAKRPSSVVEVGCSDMNDVYNKCIESLHAQRRYISDEPIAVVTQTGKLRDEFWELLVQDADLHSISILQKQNAYQPFGENSLIRVMTAHSAKGTECRAIHLLDAERYRTKNRELAFTAVTRAKTEVSLYHIAALPGHMTPRKNELPTLKDIF